MSENSQQTTSWEPILRLNTLATTQNMIEDKVAYKALISRDSRFDGLFFVGVTSTGIYCRPICPVKAPKQENCRFFDSAEAAEKASFRPCFAAARN